MFRFLRRTNLRSTKRRSASCPNLDQTLVEDDIQENNIHKNYACKSSSESDSSETDYPNKFERLKAQQSVRRGHLKEKEKKENIEKNLISMDDYLGKLSELKIWLHEERKKDVDNMRSPKLKAHFKTFVKLWNKRKLPLKYYRGCAVNLYIDDKSSEANSVTANKLLNSQYSLVEDSANYSTTVLLPPFDISCDNVLENVSSPFSTFGKCDDVFTSPTALAEKVNIAAPFGKHRGANSSQKCKYKLDRSSPGGSPKKIIISQSPGGSPTKFATISRSIPATSRLHNFAAKPRTPGVDVKFNPVPCLSYPDPHGRFVTSSLSGSPSATNKFPQTSGEYVYKTNIEQSPSLTKSSGPSPVYSSIVDAIPYSTGSPKYAEIDETIQNPLQKIPSSGYCSLSPLQEWRVPYKNVKQTVSKRQSLSRRHSKSLEDFYSIPYKPDICVKVKNTLDEEDIGLSKSPPVPDRKYSPTASFSTNSDQRDITTAALKDYSKCYISPSFQSSPLSSPGSGSQKRQSQEAIELYEHSTSSLKKAKSTLLPNSDIENSMLSATESEDASPKFSILTGSLNPTTRSRHKIHESVKPSETSNAKCSEQRLSILEIKQLDESPKLPRRRMKRRSSSLSTTPGKGLLFGKASKMSIASPKRVSFAKNVKETEKTAILGKLFSLHRCTPQNFTKQTQERKQFESFLSSHESPPRKSNSPNKVPSPDKNYSLNTTGTPAKQNSPPKNLIVTPFISESKNNTPRKLLFDYKGKEDKSYDSQLNTNNLSGATQGDGLYPSSTRQVGRRVIGAPKAFPNKNIVDSVQTFSTKTTSGGTSQAVCPQKNLSTAYQAPSHKKNVTTTSHLYSPKKDLGVLSQSDSPEKHKEKKINLTSRDSRENLGLKSKLVSPEQNMRYATNSASLYNMRISSNSLPSSKNQTAISIHKHHKSPPKFDSQLKDLTRQSSATKKMFGFPVVTSKTSIHSLVSKLTEKTTTICAKELSESDDCLSCDEIPNVVSMSNFSEIPAVFTDSPDRKSENQALGIENRDFEVVVLESSPGSKTNETDIHSHRSSATCTEVTPAKKSDSDLDDTSKTSSARTTMIETENLHMKESTPSSLHQMNTVYSTNKTCVPYSLPINETCSKVKNTEKTSSTSNGLFNQQLNAASSECEMEDISQRMSEEPIKNMPCFHQPFSNLLTEYATPQENSFQPKDLPSEVKVSCINTYSESDNDSGLYQKYDTDIQPLEDTLKSHKICGDHLLTVENSFPGLKSEHSSYTDNHENTTSAPIDKNEGHYDLKRISSIRASPKIVDNDGWITERRRSNKVKSLHSFPSAYNRILLKSSKENVLEQVAKENISHWTPDFAVVNTGENISLEITENSQEMSQKSNENLSNDISIKKYVQTNVVLTENKSIASPAKSKPATLPKPSKASLLANRKLTAAKNINTSKTTSKRRSSLARKELTMISSSRNSNENKKINSRVSIGKDKSRLSVEKDKSREILSDEKDKPRDRLSGGKSKSSKRVSNGMHKSITKKYNEHGKSGEQDKPLEKGSNVPGQGYLQSISDGHKDFSKLTSSSQRQSRLHQPGQTNRKRSSNGVRDSLVGRRRSKVQIATEESLSFAEKKKFFSQLHVNVKKQNEQALGISCHVKGSPQKQNQQVKFTPGSRIEIKSKAETPRKTLLLTEKINPSSPTIV